jgi:hypothetical protein
MTRTLLRVALLIPAFSLLGACATSQHWSPAGGDRETGIVKVSYEHEGQAEPDLSESQADRMADDRCRTWGYRDAELIPGLLRSCTNESGNRCELWKVTREYQCQNGSESAGRNTASLAHNRND